MSYRQSSIDIGGYFFNDKYQKQSCRAQYGGCFTYPLLKYQNAFAIMQMQK